MLFRPAVGRGAGQGAARAEPGPGGPAVPGPADHRGTAARDRRNFTLHYITCVVKYTAQK